MFSCIQWTRHILFLSALLNIFTHLSDILKAWTMLSNWLWQMCFDMRSRRTVLNPISGRIWQTLPADIHCPKSHHQTYVFMLRFGTTFLLLFCEYMDEIDLGQDSEVFFLHTPTPILCVFLFLTYQVTSKVFNIFCTDRKGNRLAD